jgi:hypothetical protein
MESILQKAEQLVQKEQVNETMQKIHSMIIELADSLKSKASKSEVDSIINKLEIASKGALKDKSVEDCIDSLNLIYKDFMTIEQGVLKGLGGGEQGDESMTARLSLASQFSLDKQEFNKTMEAFYDKIRSLERKLREERSQDKDEVRSIGSQFSLRSGLTNLQSAFSVTPIDTKENKESLSQFMQKIEELRNRIGLNEDNDCRSIYSELDQSKEYFSNQSDLNGEKGRNSMYNSKIEDTRASRNIEAGSPFDQEKSEQKSFVPPNPPPVDQNGQKGEKKAADQGDKTQIKKSETKESNLNESGQSLVSDYSVNDFKDEQKAEMDQMMQKMYGGLSKMIDQMKEGNQIYSMVSSQVNNESIGTGEHNEKGVDSLKKAQEETGELRFKK